MNEWIQDCSEHWNRYTFSRFLELLGDRIPLLHQLENTPQDEEWHAEGNVRVHTGMVLQELFTHLDRTQDSYSPEQKLSLVLGALLHDIAKPLTTRQRELDGRERIVAPRHASRGCSYLAYKLPGLGLPYEVIHQVMRLVALHHEPKFLVIKDRAAGSYLSLASQVDSRLLAALAYADMRGRTCPDKQKQIEYIDFFKMFCQEYGVWGKNRILEEWSQSIREALPDFPIDFVEYTISKGFRDFCAGRIFSPEEAISRTYDLREGYPRVVLMCGPSGSGKSTWCEEHFPGYELISLDLIREEVCKSRSDQSSNQKVVQIARERLRVCLREKKNVLWDATSLRRDFRSQVLSLSTDYRAHTTLVVFQLPEEQLFQRNKAREHAVPENVLAKQLQSMEWPDEREAHRTMFIDEHGQCLRDTRRALYNLY